MISLVDGGMLETLCVRCIGHQPPGGPPTISIIPSMFHSCNLLSGMQAEAELRNAISEANSGCIGCASTYIP